MTACIPIYGTNLSRKERVDALGALIFLTQKRDGKVRARKCTGRRRQRGTITKADAASPTVS